MIIFCDWQINYYYRPDYVNREKERIGKSFFARAGKFSWHFLQSCHMAGLDETGRLYVRNI